VVNGHPTTVRGLAFTPPSSERVLTVGDDGALQWWSLAAGKQIGGRYLPAPGWSVACSPDAYHFVLGLADGTVRLCNHDVKG
jgi:WD40 repeat protein